MKKLLTVFLTILMVISLAGCNNAIEEKPIDVDVPEINEPETNETIVGGFVDVEDGTLTDELKEIFNSALDGLMGASYEPVELVATQVVNGINYKFLAKGTETTNPIIEGTYNVVINKSSDGSISLLDIEVIEEKEITKEVDKSMNYWVVFYNPDGNELQRTAQQLGTTPKYEGEEPCYWDKDYWYRFVSWTDKQGNEIEEFTPINGNTYIYAKYEIGGENKFEEETEEIIPIPEPIPTPAPTPTSPCSSTDTLYYFLDVWQDGVIYDSYNYIAGTFKGDKTCEGEDIALSVEKEKWYHSSDGSTFVECEDPNHHKPNMMAAINIELNQGASMTLPDGSTLGSYGKYTKEYLPGTNYNISGNVLTIGNDQYTINTSYAYINIKGVIASGIGTQVNSGDSYEDTVFGNLYIRYGDDLPPV